MNGQSAQERELLMAALRETARGMSDGEWNMFVAETRPPTGFSQFSDPADRQRALLSSIATKQNKHRKVVDANGYEVREKGSQPQ